MTSFNHKIVMSGKLNFKGELIQITANLLIKLTFKYTYFYYTWNYELLNFKKSIIHYFCQQWESWRI